MRRLLILMFAVGATAWLLPNAAAAANRADYLDTICPDATAPVREFNVLTTDPSTSLVQGIEITNKVIAVYLKCAGEKQRYSGNSSTNSYVVSASDNFGIEGAHYAQIRAANYELALGRLQAALRRYDEARETFRGIIKLAKETIDWRVPAMQSFSSNGPTRGGSGHDWRGGEHSDYYAMAQRVHDLAVAEIEKLPEPAPAPASK